MLELLRIQVVIGDSGLLMASSPDLKGLHVMERTSDELFASLRELIPVLFAEKGTSVSVVEITPIKGGQASETPPWVVASLQSPALERVGR